MIDARAAVGPSRPLRALAIVLLCYGAGRAATVWLTSETPVGGKPDGEFVDAGTKAVPFAVPHRGAASNPPPVGIKPSAAPAARYPFVLPQPGERLSASAAIARHLAVPTAQNSVEVQNAPAVPASLAPKTKPLPSSPDSNDLPSPWSGSFYAVSRGSGALGAAPTLGGTQAGIRVYRALSHDLAATAALAASPGRGGVREASIGLAYRRGSAGAILEHGFADGNGRSGLRLIGYAGVARELSARLRLEGYGQAGLTPVGAFADGALTIERPVLSAGAAELSAGLATWGSIQRGARRVDVGPQLIARLPAGDRRLRVSAEWRVRVAGNATPGSGPSVTIGTDF